MRCWRMSAIAGAVLVIILWLFVGWGFLSSVIIGAVVALVTGTVLTRMLCTDFSAGQTAQPPVAAPQPKPAAPKAEPAAEPVAQPDATPAADPAPVAAAELVAKPVAAAAAPASAQAGSVMTPSKALPGQAELASRKGSWKYQGTAAAAASAPATPVAPAAAPDAAGKPAALKAARAGGADNLKLIKGVGPKLEGVLNGIGIYHFDQIAAWSSAEVDWADNNLVGFKGRVSRDGWVDQAKILASGGETEFSKRNA